MCWNLHHGHTWLESGGVKIFCSIYSVLGKNKLTHYKTGSETLVYLTKWWADLVVIDIDASNRRGKMLKLWEELLAVEKDRLAGGAGVTLNELDGHLDNAINEQNAEHRKKPDR